MAPKTSIIIDAFPSPAPARQGALSLARPLSPATTVQLYLAALVVVILANFSHAQGLTLEPVDAGFADTGPLHSSLRSVQWDIHAPINFDRVYRVTGDLRRFGVPTGQEMYARATNGLVAVFPRSEYYVTPRGILPIVPAGTIWVMGESIRVIAPTYEPAYNSAPNPAQNQLESGSLPFAPLQSNLPANLIRPIDSRISTTPPQYSGTARRTGGPADNITLNATPGSRLTPRPLLNRPPPRRELPEVPPQPLPQPPRQPSASSPDLALTTQPLAVPPKSSESNHAQIPSMFAGQLLRERRLSLRLDEALSGVPRQTRAPETSPAQLPALPLVPAVPLTPR